MKLKKRDVSTAVIPYDRGWTPNLEYDRYLAGIPLHGYKSNFKVGERVRVVYCSSSYCNKFCLNKVFTIVNLHGFIILDTNLYCRTQRRRKYNCGFMAPHLERLHEGEDVDSSDMQSS